jgi:hypothetical protein
MSGSPIVAAVLVLLSVAALFLVGLACSALLGLFKVMFARSRRRAYELPAGWWTRFEHDLRALPEREVGERAG